MGEGGASKLLWEVHLLKNSKHKNKLAKGILYCLINEIIIIICLYKLMINL